MIRSYSAGIEIIGDQAAYIQSVVAMLDSVQSLSAVARLICREVNRTWTNLSGFTARLGSVNTKIRIRRARNLEEIEADPQELQAATDIGARVPNRSGLGLGAGGGPSLTGTGTGSWVILPYDPSLLPAGASGAVRNREATLVHELHHALRQKQGLMRRDSVGDNFDDEEEFFSIVLVENVFRSGLGWPLRRNHHGYEEMQPPRLFFDEPRYRSYFLRYEQQMGGFGRDLASLDAAVFSYNPFREFLLAEGRMPA